MVDFICKIAKNCKKLFYSESTYIFEINVFRMLLTAALWNVITAFKLKQEFHKNRENYLGIRGLFGQLFTLPLSLKEFLVLIWSISEG